MKNKLNIFLQSVKIFKLLSYFSSIATAVVGTECNQAYITLEDTLDSITGVQRFCGNVLSDTNDDTTAGAVTSEYFIECIFSTLGNSRVRVFLSTS